MEAVKPKLKVKKKPSKAKVKEKETSSSAVKVSGSSAKGAIATKSENLSNAKLKTKSAPKETTEDQTKSENLSKLKAKSASKDTTEDQLVVGNLNASSSASEQRRDDSGISGSDSGAKLEPVMVSDSQSNLESVTLLNSGTKPECVATELREKTTTDSVQSKPIPISQDGIESKSHSSTKNQNETMEEHTQSSSKTRTDISQKEETVVQMVTTEDLIQLSPPKTQLVPELVSQASTSASSVMSGGTKNVKLEQKSETKTLEQKSETKTLEPKSDINTNVTTLPVGGNLNAIVVSEAPAVSSNQDAGIEVASLIPSAPALIDFQETGVSARDGTRTEATREYHVIYPKLEVALEEEETLEELTPYTEEDLSLLYPNPQLDANQFFIDNFVKNVNYEGHELYDLLSTYLKTKQALTNSLNQIKELKQKYATHEKLAWQFQTKEISAVGKCGDGAKVSHTYSHRIAEFHPEEALQINTSLKHTRELLQEELCIRSYSSQLARIHVEHHLYMLVQSLPQLSGMSGEAPVTSWVPSCPPGSLDSYCAHLRDSISVLFLFERRPVQDKEFSKDCRQWLNQLISILLRVSSLSDHKFLLNHLLRCPPGVGDWGVHFIQLPSPLKSQEILQTQLQHSRDSGTHNYFHDWGVGHDLQGNWGGPILDHFMTVLSTLTSPIKERERFLKFLISAAQEASDSPELARQVSSPWSFIDDMDAEVKAISPLLLEESDYVAIFEQFPFSDLFRYLLNFKAEDDYSVEQVTSHQMLRLFAFCTCLVRILGTAFTTLRLAKYKGFIKQIGQTIRRTVSYVADHWSSYRTYHLLRGESMSSVPQERSLNDPRHSLNRLQLEFDQFVLRATKWILKADKLGAWQFLADMPYGNVSLSTAWMIFWNIYCKQSTSIASDSENETGGGSGSTQRDNGGGRGRAERGFSPSSISQIQEAMRIGSHKDQFVDRLMKTYTSEAVYLLTTLVNIARARSCDSDEGESRFINTIVLEIFECTHVVEYAREAYFKTGSHLLGSIALVHPFIISTLLKRAETAVGPVGENCILLFKDLPLHLWIPSSIDIQLVRTWLLDYQLTSSESNLARVILSGLNWGTKTQEGSYELVLPWSIHCSTALLLVDAQCRHLPSHPGGRDFNPSSSSFVGKYATRFGTSLSQQQFVKWTWDMILMLKLHPHQVVPHSMQMLNPFSCASVATSAKSTPSSSTTGREQRTRGASMIFGDLQQPPWVRVDPHSNEVFMPNMESAGSMEMAELRDMVNNEGLLAYYVALSVTDLGTDTDRFLSTGLMMLNRLLDEGYYIPALRVLANVTPRFFKHAKLLMEDSLFIQAVLSIVNADSENASLKEKWVTGTSSVVSKKVSALIQTQLEEAAGPMGVGSESVLRFWLEVLLGCPNWLKERNVLLLLDTLSMAAFFKHNWTEILQAKLLEAYRALNPTQPKKNLLSSVYMSVAAIMWPDGGTPSLFNVIPQAEYPWLAYNALCAEQRFEEDEKIWKTLLNRLKKDSKISIDSALKKSFSELKCPGSFSSTHLCIYRWAEFCTTISNSHPLYPLIWQHFFTMYLAKPTPDTQGQGTESHGPRFYSSTSALSQRRSMKGSLSSRCKQLQAHIAALEEPEWAEKLGETNSSDEQREILKEFLPRCLKFYQTLRLWLEEPRLHTGSLYLPGLPPQYDSSRLSSIFQGNKSPWMEFVPMWEIKVELNSLVMDWQELAAYQKPLKCKAAPPNLSSEAASARIQKRLLKSPLSVPPPPLMCDQVPFSPFPREVLLSKEQLTASVCEDMNFLLEQAKLFTSKMSVLVMLDEEYLEGLPELYTNEPRQFHVRVPCRKKFSRTHTCSAPATIIFRFNEMTSSMKWENQLKTNRENYNATLTALATPISPDLVQKVMRMEHTVAELSRMATQHSQAPADPSANIPLQNGVALFYDILDFVRVETRHFHPTNQFLTSCMHILGQTFIQQDPLQTSKILQLLLTESQKWDILAPLFHPNLCPEQFMEMYGATVELANKSGPTVAFSVLTKFDVVSWMQSTYQPTIPEINQLLDFISQGLTLAGPKPSGNEEILIEVYRRHFMHVVEDKFPDHYQTSLQLIIRGTESGKLCASTWTDFTHVTMSSEEPGTSYLGLQQIHKSLDLLSSTYRDLRVSAGRDMYAIISSDYIPLIGCFLEQLCLGMVNRWTEDIAMESVKSSQAVSDCWRHTVEVFEPWIGSFSCSSKQGSLIYPCEVQHCGLLREMMEYFINSLNFIRSKLQDGTSSFVLSLLWTHYFNNMALPGTPHYIMDIYHTSLERLPWRSFFPDLAALDSMMKLKMDERTPPQSFVFLGRILPLFDWQTIVDAFSDLNFGGDPSTPLQFHIMLLQLLVMLTSEREIMEKDDTSIPQLILQAQNFQWHLIDSKMYQDVLNWQKAHCDSISILHKGSRLSLSLRLLKAAAGLPSSAGPRNKLNQETWEKRYSLVQVMVELVANASCRKDILSHTYSECVSNLFQIAVDVSIYEPMERNSPHIISLLQEILNLLNICSNMDGILEIFLDVIEQLPNYHLLATPTITAASQTLASFVAMTKIIEHAIECHFRSLSVPPQSPVPLPLDPINGYGWKGVTDSLVFPEEVSNTIVESSIADCAVLLLHAMVMKELLQCSTIEQEMQVVVKVLQWCTLVKPKQKDEAKLFLLWGKVIELLLRQIQFGGNSFALVPHLNSFVVMLIRFGEDKVSEGFLGTLGLGKKSIYSHRFRLISRALGVFLQCQMPVDSNGQVHIRVASNAPGFVKDSNQSGNTGSSIEVTKQGEQALQSLESLLTNKQYNHLTDCITYSTNFVTTRGYSSLNSSTLLMHLIVRLYPECRYLDLLRVSYI